MELPSLKTNHSDQLIGWRAWWNRLEAEGTREGKIKEKEEKLAKQLAGMPRIDTFFKLKGL